MEWKQQIPGCFGEDDQLFAVHPLDRKKAHELLGTLIDEHVSWSDVCLAVRDHLKERGCGPEHISQQMRTVHNLIQPWLSH